MICLGLGGVLHAKELPIVAVFDFQNNGAKLDAQQLRSLSEYLSLRFAEGCFQVVPRQQIMERLRKQKEDSYKSCYDRNCQIELGREVSAQKIVESQILKIGDGCSVGAKLYDLKKATTEIAATENVACQIKDISAAIDKISYRVCNFIRPGLENKQVQALPQPGKLIVRTNIEGARLLVDDQDKGTAPKALELSAGDYEIQVSKAGYYTKSTKVSLTSGKERELYLQLERDYPMHPYKKWGHISFWSGVGLTAVGAISWVMLSSAQDDYEAGDLGAESKIKVFGGSTISSLTLGGSLMITGAVLWWLTPDKEEWHKELDSKKAISAGILPYDDGFVFSLSAPWQ
jgi:hypothetical protein